MVGPPSAVVSLFEMCTKQCFSKVKEHPAFLRTWSFVNTSSHMVSGIAHQGVLPSCLFHVRQEQRVSSSASLVKRPDDPCSRVSDVTLARSIPSRHAHPLRSSSTQAERRAEEQMGTPRKGPRFVVVQPSCVWNHCWRRTCRMRRRSPDRVSGLHAPAAV